MIVGLGNPTKKLQNTRHNMGILFLKKFSIFQNVSLTFEKKFSGYVGFSYFQNKKIHFFIPNTFMNLSGQIIFLYANFYKISAEEILIVHDELDLNPGQLKIKYSMGHNGHNGMKNILNFFKKKKILQIYVGIGRPLSKLDICTYVLSKPSIGEFQKINYIMKTSFFYMSDLISGKILQFKKKFFLSI